MSFEPTPEAGRTKTCAVDNSPRETSRDEESRNGTKAKN
jgi:hypothetical protein